MGGTVLDVGVGAGAASLPLRPGLVVGVDANQELLDAFVERAARYAIPAHPILGRWPEVGASTPVADVVVCHHVVYNVADLASFATALSEHARNRVVVELTAEYPLAWMAPYWAALHGWTQPDGPGADDAIEVLASLGVSAHQERWRGEAQMMGESGPERVARLGRRLCLPVARHGELRHLVDQYPPPRERELVTLWWDVPGRADGRARA